MAFSPGVSPKSSVDGDPFADESDSGSGKDEARHSPLKPPQLGPDGQITLASVLGMAGLQLALASANSSEPPDAPNSAFSQVMKVISSLQIRLQENETTIADLQGKADSMDEKCRLWRRRAERSECDLAEAERRRDHVEEAAKRARMEATPLVERFMEAEVLRTQVQADEEEVQRLRVEIERCNEEIAKCLPQLTESEDMVAEISQAIAELESAHTGEISLLRSLHSEEMAELRAQHSTRIGDADATRLTNISNATISCNEELGKLRSAVDEARWQAEVYVREQQDAVRELCIRQRENTRLAKRHGESRQEALELAVKLEAMRAAEHGAPAREAELHIVRQRCALLQKTAAEWRQALERKSADCLRWRQRALQRGHLSDIPDDDVEDLDSRRPLTPQSMSSGVVDRQLPQVPPLDWSSIAASIPGSPAPAGRQNEFWSGVPTPTRHNASTRSGRATPQWQPPTSTYSQIPNTQMRRNSSAPGGRLLLESVRQYEERWSPREPTRGSPRELTRAGYPANTRENFLDQSGLLIPEPAPLPYLDETAHEYVSAAIHAAQVWADAESSGRGSMSHSPDVAAGNSGGGLPPGVDPQSRLGVAVVEAENELEMSAFLLDESAVLEATGVLQEEIMHQPPAVARRLREYMHSLSGKARHIRHH